jgi:hypothetical protein
VSDVDSRRDITDEGSTHSRPRAFGAPLLLQSSGCRSFSLMKKLLKVNGNALGRFFRKARSPRLVCRSGLCLAQKRNNFCARVPSSAVLKDELSIYETAINWLETRRGSFMR